MDSELCKLHLFSSCKDQKIEGLSGWLEHLPPNVVQGILDGRLITQKSEPCWLEIMPPEIIQEVLLRVSITYVVRCKLLCRSFQKVADSQNFAVLHLKYASDCSPFLIFHAQGEMINYMRLLNFDLQDAKVGSVKRFSCPFADLMLEFSIIGTCNGFLCLFEETRYSLSNLQGIVYNPLTGKYKVLPRPSKVIESPCAYGFGFDVGTEAYKVIMAGYDDTRLEVQICIIGSSAWRTLQSPQKWVNPCKKRGVWANGSLHWLISRKVPQTGSVQKITVFDLASETFRKITAPGGTSDLITMKGYLSAVSQMPGSWEIWTMKGSDQNLETSWSKEFIIGHYFPGDLKKSDVQVQVICRLNNGKFLIQYGCKAWCYYDPETELYDNFLLHGLPMKFETIPHVGTLISI